MKAIISIDDTDNKKGKSTFDHIKDFKYIIEKNNLGKTNYISSHQLLMHENIKYTFDNNTLSFEVEINQIEDVEKIIELGQKYIQKTHCGNSNPGFCIALKSCVKNNLKLIAFGKRAKCKLVSKSEAYNLASELGIHLSGYGENGQGVIGALAGVGLRYFGNDGIIRESVNLEKVGVMSVSRFLDKTGFERVLSIGGNELNPYDKIFISGSVIRAILLGWKSTVLVRYCKYDNIYKTLLEDEYIC